MWTTRQANRSAVALNVMVGLIPLGLLISAAVHRSVALAVAGLFIAVVMAVMTVVTRASGEAGRLLAAKADDERHAQFQLRAWAAVGQAFMALFAVLWVGGIVAGGEEAVLDTAHLRWIWLLFVGGVVGAGTVLWLRHRN